MSIYSIDHMVHLERINFHGLRDYKTLKIYFQVMLPVRLCIIYSHQFSTESVHLPCMHRNCRLLLEQNNPQLNILNLKTHVCSYEGCLLSHGNYFSPHIKMMIPQSKNVHQLVWHLWQQQRVVKSTVITQRAIGTLV